MHSVIVLVYNSPDHTRHCLTSVLDHSPPDTEIIVVDNGSDPDTIAVLEHIAGQPNAGDRFHLIRNATNLGCSTARNQGLDIATGQTVTFLDNDTIITDPDWLDRLADDLNTWPEAGAVGPKLVYPTEPKRIQFAGGGVSRTGRIQFQGRGHLADDPDFNRSCEVQFYITACMMIRRSLYNELGGFDEVFNPVQFEDIDLCYRMREHGYKVVYVPTVEVTHAESVTTAGSGRIKNAYVVVKHGLIFKKRWKHLYEIEDGPEDSDIVDWSAVSGSAGFPKQDKETQ